MLFLVFLGGKQDMISPRICAPMKWKKQEQRFILLSSNSTNLKMTRKNPLASSFLVLYHSPTAVSTPPTPHPQYPEPEKGKKNSHPDPCFKKKKKKRAKKKEKKTDESENFTSLAFFFFFSFEEQSTEKRRSTLISLVNKMRFKFFLLNFCIMITPNFQRI